MEFIVEENNNTHNYDYNKILETVNTNYDKLKNNDETDMYECLKLDYSLNTTVKELKKIATYYKLEIRKKNKEALIESVVLFELNPENLDFVENRKLMWHYFETLKEDPFFRKYIIIE